MRQISIFLLTVGNNTPIKEGVRCSKTTEFSPNIQKRVAAVAMHRLFCIFGLNSALLNRPSYSTDNLRRKKAEMKPNQCQASYSDLQKASALSEASCKAPLSLVSATLFGSASESEYDAGHRLGWRSG